MLHSVAYVEPIRDYAAAGSGAAYAELLMKDLYEPRMKTRGGVLLSARVIDEVKQIDPDCGGPTKIAVISSEGVKIFSQTEVEEAESTLKGIPKLRLDLLREKLLGDPDETEEESA